MKITERRNLGYVHFDDCWPGQDQFVAKIQIGIICDIAFVDKIDEYLPSNSREYLG